MKNIDIIIDKNNQYANAEDDKQNDLTTTKYITKIKLSMLQLINTIKKERFAYEDTVFNETQDKNNFNQFDFTMDSIDRETKIEDTVEGKVFKNIKTSAI